MEDVVKFNQAFKRKEALDLPIDFFHECYTETIKLILENHWNKYVRIMKKMRRFVIFNDEICLTPLSFSDTNN